MIEVTLGNVEVLLGGEPRTLPEDRAQAALEQIISIGKDAPEPIRIQAEATKAAIYTVVLWHIRQALKEHGVER